MVTGVGTGLPSSRDTIWTTRDRNVSSVAARQRGLVLRTQLRDCGLTDRAIARRVAAGRLHRFGPGIYLVGHPVLPPLAREQAALLTAGPAAALSHHTAAHLYAIVRAEPPAVHVTVTGSARPRARPGLVVHRAPLGPADVRRRESLRLTSPARTLLDLASVLDRPALERAVHEAQVLRLVTEREIAERIARAGPLPGVRALRTAISDPHVTRNVAESRLLALLRRIGAEPTATNTILGGHEVDVLFAPQRLVLELDGFAAHGTRRAFERDHVRDGDLAAAGYRTFRVTWRRLTRETRALERTLKRALTS